MKYIKFEKILLAIMVIMITKIDAQNEKSITEKVNGLISQMTLDEKIGMLHGNTKFSSAGVERLGIPDWKMSDGPHGVREEINPHSWEAAGWDNDFSTYLPVSTALAATWNPELAYEFGKVLGSEARARGKDVILGPGINIHRTPLCGRNFEYMSEDPHLSSTMVVPYIKGVQEQDVASCLKHFSLNNQEYERFDVDVKVDERTMREIYLPAFESAVKEGKVLTVMSAYNKVNGYWCSENKYLLNDILKKEWGFKGVVISDWNGTHSTLDAANAGLDIEMGTDEDNYNNYYFADKLKTAVGEGKIGIERIDSKVRRILTTMFKSKVFDKSRSKGELISKNNFEVAKRVAEEAVVLLKNSANILPLNKSELKSIAVIGENAIVKHAAGGGSSGVKTKYEISPLEALQNKFSDKVTIQFTEGYKTTTTFDWQDGVNDTSISNSEYKKRMINDAVEVAQKSDMVLMFLGLNHHYDNESTDRSDMKLPYGQDKLIKEVLKVNKNVVIILIGGSPVDMSEWIEDVPAIVQGWYAGSEAGNVFADILFGDVNPSGKLPFTFPKNLEDSPAHKIGEYPGKDFVVHYKEGIFVGYRYFDSFDVKPQFAFGYGLSYTEFELKNIELSKTRFTISDEIEVAVTVKNIGRRKGKEVVQLYIQDELASVERPHKELKEFKKVELNPNEERVVKFNINKKMLSFYDVELKSWKAEEGTFKIHVGNSSDNIKLTAEIELVATK